MKIVLICLTVLFSFTSNAFAFSAYEEQFMSTPKRCASPEADELDRLLIENELNVLRARRNFRALDINTIQPIRIPVYVHVIMKGSAATDGNVDADAIDAQIDVMNKAYASMQISFELAGVDRTTNAKWYAGTMWTSSETDMKNALRKGDAGALNVYLNAANDGTLGWATFPWDYMSKPKMDGVVIHFQTLPGGTFEQYNLGMTLVHEAGHWLGLFHTFQGGCNGGDSVDDTPAESKPNFGCPTMAPDSCPSHAGNDPINNFMDYSDDVCLTDFSSGQIQRVHDSYTTYRD